ncbi:hypothetical protein B7P43_G16517 [Cryptotermes secundus]|uniref:DOMON domain-containing protein n=1 Tax=Cryptotermes secundus TaxID=105785 RepID=A0A2J7RLX0_9NEOP|nr:hypothetical protein B7P43_G16517 [Cryptotermes secundus]
MSTPANKFASCVWVYGCLDWYLREYTLKYWPTPTYDGMKSKLIKLAGLRSSRGCGRELWVADGAMAWTGAILLTLALGHVTGAHWTHSTDLDPNYSVFWTPGEEDITFEVQVRTLGYVGFGFSADGQMAGADMVTGWVRDNQVFFQVGPS